MIKARSAATICALSLIAVAASSSAAATGPRSLGTSMTLPGLPLRSLGFAPTLLPGVHVRDYVVTRPSAIEVRFRRSPSLVATADIAGISMHIKQYRQDSQGRFVDDPRVARVLPLEYGNFVGLDAAGRVVDVFVQRNGIHSDIMLDTPMKRLDAMRMMYYLKL
jgi:hypothetical protein